MPSALSPARRHMPALDGIRGLAILLVLLVHAYYRGPDLNLPSGLEALLVFGWTGVELFFVLSGFLITSILLDAKGQHGALAGFLVNRAARLCPLYFSLLALLFGLGQFELHPKLDRSLDEYSQNLPVYWLYLSNLSEVFAWQVSEADKVLGPTWSLATEQQFYMLWPLVVFSLPRNAALRLLLVALGLMLILRATLIWQGAAPEMVYHASILHFDGIAAGSIAALTLPALAHRRQLCLAFLVLAAGALVATFLATASTDYKEPAVQTVGYPLIAAFYAALLLVTLQTPALTRWFSCAPLCCLGKYSYFIYLAHWPLYLWVDRLPIPAGPIFWLMTFAVSTGLLVILGWLSWQLLERPAAQAIRRLRTDQIETVAAHRPQV